MPSPDSHIHSIRKLIPEDRPAVARIVAAVGNFNRAEIECALELVDVFLTQSGQRDYNLVVSEDSSGQVCGYACWGPTPLTHGTYDLYWIATHPEAQGRGVGAGLMEYVEQQVRAEHGRLLVLETSAKESYGKTVAFYHRLGYAEAARVKDFYDVGDDKLVFVKRLS